MSLRDDPKELGEAQKEFLWTPLGQYLREKLVEEYRRLHDRAGDPELSAEKKAFLIERACGVKTALDLVNANAILLDSGGFKDE